MKYMERMKNGQRWLRSSILGPSILGVAAVSAFAMAVAPGCVVYTDDDHDDHHNHASEVSIDEGASMQATPGEGVGVFIEYAGEGRWQIWSTCDTDLSNQVCQFELYLKGEDIDLVDQLDLEGYDYVSRGDDELYAYFENDYDTDGITLIGEEDEPLSVEIWIDGRPNGEYAFWIQDGNIVQGLPSNPTLFNPGGASDPPDPPEATQVGIEEGTVFDVDPGRSIGLYTEYLGEGRWNVWSTCNTEISSASCVFDFTATGKNLTVLSDLDLEDPDYIEASSDRIQGHYETSVDFDGITILAEEDEPLTLEVWLDGSPNGAYVFWHDNNTVNQGLPSNPATFVPNL